MKILLKRMFLTTICFFSSAFLFGTVALADSSNIKVNSENFLNYFNVNGDASYDTSNGTLTLTQSGISSDITNNSHSGNATLKNKINTKGNFVLKG